MLERQFFIVSQRSLEKLSRKASEKNLTPSQMLERLIKDMEEPSDNGKWNAICHTCGRIITQQVETEKEAKKAIDRHIEGKQCTEVATRQITPQKEICNEW